MSKKKLSKKEVKEKEIETTKSLETTDKIVKFIFKGVLFFGVIALIAILSVLVSKVDKYELNEDIKEEDLLRLYDKDNKKDVITVCDNCYYLGTAEMYEGSVLISTMMEMEYENGEYNNVVKEEYDKVYTTGEDIGTGSHYKEVISKYGVKKGEAYWNIKEKNDKFYYKKYEGSYIESENILSAILTFAYYKDGKEWKLMPYEDIKGYDGQVLTKYDEYIIYNFEFPFNRYAPGIRNGTLGSFGIMHYKK